ncbi:cysteine hydrolase family protein [Allostreptomyces psammosilenae]|uniref:Ureidoacrylate peracid hydrolase n=1 Tax=Allostreptomyces psammosilenae TaxID=1892865 RepID=A0A853A2S2_9ACTN|nr:cysteine hydrolase [Allostreptomyces psammosilenae]NYI07770.1 ureidoacrylate peracid hydrolase [Allostreptomyces psammosilenae]
MPEYAPTSTQDRRRLTLAARPEPLTTTLEETAVVVVDMQNDFGAEGGGVHLGGHDISVVRAAIEPTARVLSAARRAGVPVIYLKHGYLPDLSDMGPRDSKNWIVHAAARVGQPVPAPDGTQGRVLVQDTWNTEILPELAPEAGDIVLRKNRFSAFYGTDLDATLRRLGVRTIVVTGCTTSVCMESTIRDAMFRDYLAVLLADCTGEPQGRAHHESSLVLVERLLGWVSDSESLLRALAELPTDLPADVRAELPTDLPAAG